jgi:hypothetical protein
LAAVLLYRPLSHLVERGPLWIANYNGANASGNGAINHFSDRFYQLVPEANVATD